MHSDRAGSGRAPLEPIPATKQRAGAQPACGHACSSADSFRFSPAFLSRLAITRPRHRRCARARPQRADGRRRGRPAGARRAALGAGAAAWDPRSRSACSTTSSRCDDPAEALTARRAVRRRCTARSGASSSPARTSRSSGATCSASTCRASRTTLLRPAPTMPADARALLRADATEAARRARRGCESGTGSRWKRKRTSPRALAMLDEALKAPLHASSAVAWRMAEARRRRR